MRFFRGRKPQNFSYPVVAIPETTIQAIQQSLASLKDDVSQLKQAQSRLLLEERSLKEKIEQHLSPVLSNAPVHERVKVQAENIHQAVQLLVSIHADWLDEHFHTLQATGQGLQTARLGLQTTKQGLQAAGQGLQTTENAFQTTQARFQEALLQVQPHKVE